jgi:hypothetical protein
MVLHRPVELAPFIRWDEKASGNYPLATSKSFVRPNIVKVKQRKPKELRYTMKDFSRFNRLWNASRVRGRIFFFDSLRGSSFFVRLI